METVSPLPPAGDRKIGKTIKFCFILFRINFNIILRSITFVKLFNFSTITMPHDKFVDILREMEEKIRDDVKKQIKKSENVIVGRIANEINRMSLGHGGHQPQLMITNQQE